MPSCFVIMPLTTLEHSIPIYGGDSNHFTHVLEHLFIPAIKSAGFEPIKPIAKGSELIQAEIIKNLENSELVLCDMSLLNPNVFFELGIRTALNKSVCMLKDDKTEKVPFDTTIINYHTYKSDLAPWILEQEIESLKSHIEASKDSNDKSNALWRYFSMDMKAQPLKEASGVEGRLDFLNMQMKVLRRQIETLSISGQKHSLLDELQQMVITQKIPSSGHVSTLSDSGLNICFNEELPADLKQAMINYAAFRDNVKLTITSKSKNTYETPDIF